MSTDIAVLDSLNSLTTLSETQQDMLGNIMARFSGQASGPVGIDLGDEEGQPLRLPALKIKQRMTTDVGCPDTAKDGDLYTTTGDILPRPVKFIPVAIWNSHIMFEAGGGKNVVCYSPDSKLGTEFGKCSDCQHQPWKDNNRTDCDRTLNAIIMTEDLGLYHVRFFSMSYPAGKNLVRFARAMPNLWSRYFKLETSPRTNQKGPFQVFEVKAVQELPSPDVQKVGEFVCRSLADARKGMLEGFYARVNGGTTLTADDKIKIVNIDAGDAEPDFDGGM